MLLILLILSLILFLSLAQPLYLYVDPLITSGDNFTGNNTYASVLSAVKAANLISKQATLILTTPREHNVLAEVNISCQITIMQSGPGAVLRMAELGRFRVQNNQTLRLVGIVLKVQAQSPSSADSNASLSIENTALSFSGTGGSSFLKCLGNSSLTIYNLTIGDYSSATEQPLFELSSIRLADIRKLTVISIIMPAAGLFLIYDSGSGQLTIETLRVSGGTFAYAILTDSLDEIGINALEISEAVFYSKCLSMANTKSVSLSALTFSANTIRGSLIHYRGGRSLSMISSRFSQNRFQASSFLGSSDFPFYIELPSSNLIIELSSAENNWGFESNFFQMAEKSANNYSATRNLSLKDLIFLNNSANKTLLKFFIISVESTETPAGSGELYIRNCSFKGSSYAGVISIFQKKIDMKLIISEFEVLNCYLSEYQSLFLLNHADISLKKGKFHNNSGNFLNSKASSIDLSSASVSPSNGFDSILVSDLIACQSSSLSFTDTIFKINNYVELKLEISWNSFFSARNSNFESTFTTDSEVAAGLEFIFSANSTAYLEGVNFTNICFTHRGERAGLSILERSSAQITNLNFNNCSFSGPLLDVRGSLLSITNLNVSQLNNIAAPLFEAQSSSLLLSFLTFTWQDSIPTLETPLFQVERGLLSLLNFSFFNIKLQDPCPAFIFALDSDLKIGGGLFFNIISTNNASSIILVNKSPMIELAEVLFLNCFNLINLKCTSVKKMIASQLYLNKIQGAALLLAGVGSLNISDIYVSNVVSASPALCLINEANLLLPSAQHAATITKATFINCTAGALAVKNSNLSVSRSTFLFNSASRGGGLFYFCAFSLRASFSWGFKDSRFIYNQAEQAGAGFFWEHLPPSDCLNNMIQNNTLINRSNNSQGGSNPVKLRLRFSRQTNEQSVEAASLKSGFIFELLDAYNNICSYSNAQGLYLYLNASTMSQKILSSHTFYSDQGVWLIRNLLVKLEKGSSAQLIFSTEAISLYNEGAIQFEKEIIDPAASHQVGDSQDYLYVLNVKSRQCLTGERITEIGCQLCPEGTYSIQQTPDNKSSSYSCQTCPKNAFCPGGSVIKIDPGFWRFDNDTGVSLFQCTLLPAACLGGSGLADQLCVHGYSGPLCSVCIYNSTVKFYKNYYQECADCSSSDHPISIIIALLLTFGLLLQVLYSIRESYDRLLKGGTPAFAFLSYMLLSYFQMVFLLNEVEIATPSFFKHLSRYFSFINNFHNISRYADCSFSDAAFKRSIPIFLMKNIVGNILLIFLYVITFVISWIIYKFYGQSKFKNINFLGFAIIPQVALYKALFIPMLTFYLKTFYCVKVGENSYLGADLGIVCWSKNHVSMIILSIFSALACLVMPFLLAFVLLKRNRRNFFKIGIREQVILIIIGFKKSFYFWEFVNASRKVLIVLVIIFCSSDAILLGLLLLLISFSYNVLLVAINPYESKNLYFLDFMQGVSIFVTISGMLYFVNADVIVEHVLIILFIFVTNLSFLGFNLFLILKYFKYMKRQRVINEAKGSVKADLRGENKQEQRNRNVPIYESDKN